MIAPDPCRTKSVATWLAVLSVALVSACATMPPGANYPKVESSALAHPEETAIGRKVEPRAKAHSGLSGFRLFASGSDAFTVRLQMADTAERTVDVQYFIFKDDDSGKLLMSAMLRAAERGVRVRLLVDDTEARGQDDRVGLLAAHPNIDVRLYNPFFYRGSNRALRYAEFALTTNRLNYRMHNKLFIADNELAMVGGRNVGDEYFDTGNDAAVRRLRRVRDGTDHARPVEELRRVLEQRALHSGARVIRLAADRTQARGDARRAGRAPRANARQRRRESRSQRQSAVGPVEQRFRRCMGKSGSARRQSGQGKRRRRRYDRCAVSPDAFSTPPRNAGANSSSSRRISFRAKRVPTC